MAQWTMMVMASLLWGTQAPSDQAILGIWLTEDNEATMEIYRCGEFLCGKIADLKEKVYSQDDKLGMAGKPKIDRKNPDESLRNRPIIGLTIMEGFRPTKSGWGSGTIYDPDRGKTYRCKMKLVDGGKKLYVRGFIGVSLLGRTTHWRRPE